MIKINVSGMEEVKDVSQRVTGEDSRKFSRRRLIRGLINCHRRALGLFYEKRPVPLSYWLFFRSAVQVLSRSPDPLFSTQNYSQSSGASLPIQELAEVLRDDLLGVWALDGDTISFLWKVIQRDRPKVIVECGAGVSTLVFAKGLQKYGFGSTNFASLLSIEQNLWFKEAVEHRLEACGLKDCVTVLHTPISKEGDYQLDANHLREHLGSEKVDWLIIDGPAGPEGCRLSTLPFLARFCRPGARWFLDDAFRDGELGMLNQWSSLSGIVVEGIYPFGKGLATGIVKDPEQITNS